MWMTRYSFWMIITGYFILDCRMSVLWMLGNSLFHKFWNPEMRDVFVSWRTDHQMFPSFWATLLDLRMLVCTLWTQATGDVQCWLGQERIIFAAAAPIKPCGISATFVNWVQIVLRRRVPGPPVDIYFLCSSRGDDATGLQKQIYWLRKRNLMLGEHWS